MSINFSRNSITASRTFVLIIYSMLSSRLNKHKKTKQHLIPISKNRASVFGGSEQDQCSLNMINYYLIWEIPSENDLKLWMKFIGGLAIGDWQ